MLVIGVNYIGGAIVMCYFWGNGIGVFLMEEGWELLEIGKVEIFWLGDDVFLLGYGFMVYFVL